MSESDREHGSPAAGGGGGPPSGPASARAAGEKKPTFHLGPIPVHVGLGFFLMAFFLGGIGKPLQEIAAWVAVVFVAVMVHELGHALTALRFGLRPTITLHMMGGLTSFPGGRLTRWRSIAVSAAGPLAGFAFGAFGLAVAKLWAPPWIQTGLGKEVLVDFLWANFGWGAINLLPVLPWDGGLIVKDLASSNPAVGLRRALWVSTLVGATIAVLALLLLRTGGIWIAFLFGMSAWQAYSALRHRQDVSSGVVDGLVAAQQALQAGELERALAMADVVRRRASHAEHQIVADFIAADALLGLGRPDEAIARCPVDGSDASVLIRREALVALERYAAAAEEEMTAYRRTRDALHAFEAARAWALASQRGPALEWLARAAEGQTDRRRWRDDPAFASLRDDPAFLELVRGT